MCVFLIRRKIGHLRVSVPVNCPSPCFLLLNFFFFVSLSFIVVELFLNGLEAFFYIRLVFVYDS